MNGVEGGKGLEVVPGGWRVGAKAPRGVGAQNVGDPPRQRESVLALDLSRARSVCV